jgi:hypothetical protein
MIQLSLRWTFARMVAWLCLRAARLAISAALGSWQPWPFEFVRCAPRVPRLILVHSRIDANLAPGENPPQKS